MRSVKVNGHLANWSRSDDHELIVTPRHRLHRGKRFTTVVRYDGVPRTQVIPGFGIEAGFIHTDDGAIIAGQPEVAANWFPVNDHPLDKASYTIEMTVPAGLEVIGNGRLIDHRTRNGLTTWTWATHKPMASYLAISVGHFDIRSSQAGRRQFYDAVDPDLKTDAVDRRRPDRPDVRRDRAEAALAAQPEVINFLSGVLGRYPFSPAGGSSTTTPSRSSRWRTRPAPSTTSTSSSVPIGTDDPWSCTRWHTSGSATACPRPLAATSG